MWLKKKSVRSKGTRLRRKRSREGKPRCFSDQLRCLRTKRDPVSVERAGEKSRGGKGHSFFGPFSRIRDDQDYNIGKKTSPKNERKKKKLGSRDTTREAKSLVYKNASVGGEELQMEERGKVGDRGCAVLQSH